MWSVDMKELLTGRVKSILHNANLWQNGRSLTLVQPDHLSTQLKAC